MRANAWSTVVIGVLTAAPTLGAQSLASRVAAAPDGVVRFAFAARPGPATRHADGAASACDSGPVHVELTKQHGVVVALEVWVGAARRLAAPGAVDLGPVGTAEAARYLLHTARAGSANVGPQAIFAASLADTITVWPDLLALARNAHVAVRTRRAAVFWVGQAAGAAVARGLTDLVEQTDAAREVQEAAVFALSQRPADEAVPALIVVARAHRDPRVRRQAMFWLSQSGDPRAVDFFAEVLAGS